MNIKPITDAAFAAFGKVIDGYQFTPLLEQLSAHTEAPADKVVYVPSLPLLESLAVSQEIQHNFYGGMPIQVGYCNGTNHHLNCLEYHRDSEVNVAATDMVLLLARQQDIAEGVLDTTKVEAFLQPKGTATELYATTLHYAPCGHCFRVAVILPRGTNEKKPNIVLKNNEDKLLWACNKWLLAHPQAPEAALGAYIGLTGENISLSE